MLSFPERKGRRSTREQQCLPLGPIKFQHQTPDCRVFRCSRLSDRILVIESDRRTGMDLHAVCLSLEPISASLSSK